ncbi:MAG: YscB family type III secretion system chaperone [Aeromonas sp.]
MQNLLNRLAARLGQEPFVSDAQGGIFLRIDGYSLSLAPRSGALLISSPLTSGDVQPDLAMLKRLLQQVVAWGRHTPHGLVLDELGNLHLEARLALEWLDDESLEASLGQHIALLERLQPQLIEATRAPRWRQMIWHP